MNRDPQTPFDALDEAGHFRRVAAPPRRLPLSALARGKVAAATVPRPPAAPAPSSAPTQAPRVLFEEDFAPRPLRKAAPPPPPPPPPEPSFTAAELEEARRAAFREGKDAGRTAARAEAEAAGQAALAAIAAGFGTAAAEAEAAREQAAEAAVRLVLGALDALHPALSERLAEADIAAMVQALLPQLAGEPRLAIRLCPPLVETLGPRLAALAEQAGFRGEVSLRADPAIAPDGAAVSWSAGAALRDPAGLRSALLASLEPLGLAPLMPE